MFYHNLKMAFRSLSRHKTFSFINILGLTIGLASCIVIGLYAMTELSFDKFHRDHSQIYRVNKRVNEKGGAQSSRNGITPGLLAPALVTEIPEATEAARFRPWFNDVLVSRDTIRIKLADVGFADQGFLKMFSFPLISGDARTALLEPFTAIITKSTAQKFFGDTDPLGKVMKTLDEMEVRITGVAEDVPLNSSMNFNMLISWPTITTPAKANSFSWMNNWQTQVNFTFVKLKKGADAAQTETKISNLMHSNMSEEEYKFEPYLQPLDDIHLKSAGIQYADAFHTNNITLVYVLLVIAGFILVIASFNFINLSTAGALSRAKETGVQKVLGARRNQLIQKFFGESFVICALSMIVAVALVILVLPVFNQFAGSSLSPETLQQPQVISGLMILLIGISILSGVYPAIFLSRFRSSDIFRNVIKASKDSWLRKSLVTTQFALSILLIIATLVMKKQTNYLMTKDLGFDKEQILVMQVTNTGLESKSKQMIDALQQYPGVAFVSATNRVPGQSFNGYGIVPEGHTLQEHLMANVLETDAAFASTYNIEMVKGRYFSPQQPTDTNSSIVINEAMARYLNWNDPVGKEIEIYEAMKGKVIGVMKDFNLSSLRENIEPVAVMLRSNPLYISIKIEPGAIKTTLPQIAAVWEKMESEYPFDYFFLDDRFNEFYQSDVRKLNVLGIFSVLAIFIGCMGLLGLSIYTAKQRTKEIGIRKVLGASVTNVLVLMSKDYVKLIAIASLIAFPAAWWAANKWLQDFAYRIQINWIMFLAATVVVAVIALFTISIQSFRTAVSNPVKSLRTE